MQKPLVVGKTGSLTVNIGGTDLSLSTNIDDGPARRFLNEINALWDKTQILIVPCNSEQEALNKEKEIVRQFGLFQS